jgi:hypothetical protein
VILGSEERQPLVNEDIPPPFGPLQYSMLCIPWTRFCIRCELRGAS